MTRNKKPLPIPEFKTEAEEREFWENPKTNALDYFDMENAVRYDDYTNPPTRSISLRLPVPLLEELKQLAGKLDVPYQSLMKVYLGERVDAEFGRGKFAARPGTAAVSKSGKPKYGNFVNPLPATSEHDAAARPKPKKRKTG